MSSQHAELCRYESGRGHDLRQGLGMRRFWSRVAPMVGVGAAVAASISACGTPEPRQHYLVENRCEIDLEAVIWTGLDGTSSPDTTVNLQPGATGLIARVPIDDAVATLLVSRAGSANHHQETLDLLEPKAGGTGSKDDPFVVVIENDLCEGLDPSVDG